MPLPDRLSLYVKKMFMKRHLFGRYIIVFFRNVKGVINDILPTSQQNCYFYLIIVDKNMAMALKGLFKKKVKDCTWKLSEKLGLQKL